MTRAILLFFIFTLALSFFIWIIFEKYQEYNIRKYISENINPDYNIDYNLRTTGYPNRLDTTVENIKLTSKLNSLEIKIQKIVIFSLIYNKKKYIIFIDTPINIKTDNLSVTLLAKNLKASFTNGKNEFLNKFTIYGEEIDIILNNLSIFKVTDAIVAKRLINLNSNSSLSNEFFIKLNKPLINNIKKNKIENYKYSFLFNKIKGIKLKDIILNSDFFKKK